jgi:hypothetical protein
MGSGAALFCQWLSGTLRPLRCAGMRAAVSGGCLIWLAGCWEWLGTIRAVPDRLTWSRPFCHWNSGRMRPLWCADCRGASKCWLFGVVGWLFGVVGWLRLAENRAVPDRMIQSCPFFVSRFQERCGHCGAQGTRGDYTLWLFVVVGWLFGMVGWK